MDVFGWLGSLVLQFGDSVISVAAGVIGWAVGLLADLIITLSAALPDDPFDIPELVSQWETGLAWLNWWLPIGQLAAILAAWVAATLAYFSFQFILKHYVSGR